MIITRITLLALVTTLSLLSSCAILPHSTYTRPGVSIPQHWQGPSTTGTSIASHEKWWGNFNDPLLDALIDKALLTNNDLAVAAIKVQRARLQANLTDTNMTPSVDVSASGTFSRDLRNRTGSQSYQTSGSLSYELDLWGRLARLRDAGRWEAEATEVDRQNSALSLIGTVAAAYWQVAYLNQRITLSEASVAYAKKTLDLVVTQRNAGAVSTLDVAQARQNLAQQKADLTTLVQQRVEARNALAILFDQPAEDSLPERVSLPESPLPGVEAGIPADVLKQRPDLRAAEMRLRETLAQTDAVRASFYPTFTLTGNLGTASTSLTNILQNPVASLGAGLVLPFVQWNTTKLTIKISETEYQEAVVTFRQTFYQALSDVENALSDRVQLEEEKLHREESFESSALAEKLAEVRYRAGAVGLQTWLDAQENRRNAETSLAQNRQNLLNNRMTLYLAFGGNGISSEKP
ncbi:MAG: efflux transporter outer membrane subunit [Geobacteraceae bacterium]|nr:efflux transporter outer membrane subunit [Geobacteraceae bacterium]